MNRIEAFSYLKEFPTQKLKMIKGYIGDVTNCDCFIKVEDNVIVYSDTGEAVPLFINDLSEFEVNVW